MADAETQALVEQLRRFRTSIIADCLDAVGATGHVVGPALRPLDPSMTIAGVARPALASRTYGRTERPYPNLIALVDSLQPLDVPVFTTSGHLVTALWGELLSTAAMVRGAAGLVVDGLVRDAREIAAMGFPVFATGLSPADPNGRAEITHVVVEIECAGARVRPGDLVLADFDGLVIVPRELAAAALERAERKTQGEDRTREEIARGRSVAEVFAELGIL
jgi:4-hydroxy-4-methyl-2-oxoglutarate aldolase